MKDNVYLFGFGTFGHPNGFRQSAFKAADQKVVSTIKTFDLNTNAIQLYPGSKLYSIRKEIINGSPSIAYSIYTYAKEKNSDRGGTFIGSSILFLDEIADENVTLSKLNEFHYFLVSKNTKNDVIMIDHSDKFESKLPKDFDKINFGLKKIKNQNSHNRTNQSLVVFSETRIEILINYFKVSLKLLSKYDTIYFTDSQQVAKFVNDKNIFQLIQNVGDKREFEQEIHLFTLENEKKILEQIALLTQDSQDLDIEKRTILQKLENNRTLHKAEHLKNEKKLEASAKLITDIKLEYTNFNKEILNTISELKNKQSLEKTQKEYSDKKKEFLKKISHATQKASFTLNSFSENNLHENRSSIDSFYNINQDLKSTKKKKPKYNIYKIISAITILSLLSVITYSIFLFRENKKISKSFSITQDSLQFQKDSIVNIIRLHPFPNDSLVLEKNEDLHKKLKDSANIEKVVELVFSAYPESTKKYYQYQKEEYKKLLFSKNEHSFQITEKDTFFLEKDSLRLIPIKK